MRVASAEEDAVQFLFEVAEAQAQLDLLRADVANRRDGIIPLEVKMELDAYDDEHAAVLVEGERRLAGLKKRARLAATQHGVTVKGERVQAVVYEQVTWDDVGLREFLVDRLDPRDLSFALYFRTCKTVCQIQEVK